MDSRFPDEDERLFLSTLGGLRLESIIVIKTTINHQKYFRPFYMFDCMLSGMSAVNFDFDIHRDPRQDIFNVSAWDIEVLNDLIYHKLHGRPHKRKHDPYVVDTFNVFCFKKEDIHISFHFLARYFPELSDLITHPIINYGENGSGEEVDDTSNLLKPHIFQILPNVKKVTIHTTYSTTSYADPSRFEYPEYKFLWSSFLSFIESGRSSVTYRVLALRRRIGPCMYSGVTWLEGIDCKPA
eukprot:260337_1